MTSDKQPPAGWYDDPTMVNTRRYWDGAKWTPHRQEKPSPPPKVGQRDDDYSSWISWGYILAFLFAPAGLLIGISRIGAEPKWAWRVIGLSLGVMLVGIVVYAYTHS